MWSETLASSNGCASAARPSCSSLSRPEKTYFEKILYVRPLIQLKAKTRLLVLKEVTLTSLHLALAVSGAAWQETVERSVLFVNYSNRVEKERIFSILLLEIIQ